MADYRLIMTLLVQQRPYRQIEVMAGCSHRAIARARRVLEAERLSTAASEKARRWSMPRSFGLIHTRFPTMRSSTGPTRNARAISSVVRPPRSRSVSATRASVDSTG